MKSYKGKNFLQISTYPKRSPGLDSPEEVRGAAPARGDASAADGDRVSLTVMALLTTAVSRRLLAGRGGRGRGRRGRQRRRRRWRLRRRKWRSPECHRGRQTLTDLRRTTGPRGRGARQSLKNETRDTDKITPSFSSSAVSAASPSALKVGHYGASSSFKCGWEAGSGASG